MLDNGVYSPMSCLVLDVPAATWNVAVPRERPAPPPPSLAASDEKVILQACQDGREEAFAALVDRYTDRVFWVAYNIVGDADDARDVSQEAFLKVFRSIAVYDIEKNFYTWLYKIVVNVGIDFLRKKKSSGASTSVSLERIGDIEDRGEAPVPRLERKDMKDEIRRVLDAMPEKYRTILVLRNVEGKNCREIADLLGANHATVRWQLHKARQIFMDMWSGDELPARGASGTDEEDDHGL